MPAYASNILFQIFNGVGAMFDVLLYRLDVFKKESNILTADNLSSLRHLTSMNGFEPTLPIPAKGILSMNVKPQLFGRTGFPLFINPESIFINKQTKLEYCYIGSKSIRIDKEITLVPVIEGKIKKSQFIAEGDYISRFYLQEQAIANDSISVISNGFQYLEVKSFFDNEGLNDNRQFEVKYSNDSQNPIVIYVKELEAGQVVDVTYRLTSGELGNLNGVFTFEADNITNNVGVQIIAENDELSITNVSGFNLGSNGTDENALRSSIGFNHGISLLFDNVSYTNFLLKYSSVLLQAIKLQPDNRAINNIYISRKVSVIDNNSTADYIKQYQRIIDNKEYLFSKIDMDSISSVLDEYEYCMSSHNLFNSHVNRYALQIKFESEYILEQYKDSLERLIYQQFTIFFYNKNHIINMERLLDDFIANNSPADENLKIDYILFNEEVEEEKFKVKSEYKQKKREKYIISHTEKLPLLSGKFFICDTDYQKIDLFFDINFISNETINI
jgi:hypothetical protein